MGRPGVDGGQTPAIMSAAGGGLTVAGKSLMRARDPERAFAALR